jgi:hypothetical protein
MIGIPSPVASHRRLFSPLADRQRAAALFNGAMAASSRRQTQAKANPPCDDRQAIRLQNPTNAGPNLAATVRRRPTAIFKSPQIVQAAPASFLHAVSSLGGFRTPASPCLAHPRQSPASETLHHCRRSGFALAAAAKPRGQAPGNPRFDAAGAIANANHTAARRRLRRQRCARHPRRQDRKVPSPTSRIRSWKRGFYDFFGFISS